MAGRQQLQSQQEEMNVVHSSGQELSPGFRFKPSDNEIVSYYLTNKVRNPDFTCTAIGEVNLNMIEPWDLPKEAKWGKKEWYFFQKDRKYPTGLRVKWTTNVGYWKVTGKDKKVYDTTQGVPLLVGMKNMLVFYKGKAPEGDKTNWVMHEYMLEGSGGLPDPTSASSSVANSIAAMKASASKDEWVVCRVFHKTSGIKKTTTPAYQVVMADAEIDQNLNNNPPTLIPMPLPLPMPVPVPMHIPMIPDFSMDLVGPYYPNVGAGLPRMVPPIVPGDIQINGALFGNPIAMLPNMVFCQQMDMGAEVGQMGMAAAVGQIHMEAIAGQMGMGAVGAGGFDGAASESGPSSIVSQNDEQANASEISSMMSVTGPMSATTTLEMDGIWEYRY